MSGGGQTCREQGHAHVVTARRVNHSAFSGYRATPSEYSEVRCIDTGARWRTKAAYADDLPDAKPPPRGYR